MRSQHNPVYLELHDIFQLKLIRSLCIKSFSKSTLQFWKKWVEIVVYLVLYTTFIDFWDALQNANRHVIIFQKFFVFFEDVLLNVTSAFFRLLGTTLLNRELLKLWSNIMSKSHNFDKNIILLHSFIKTEILY